MFYSQCKNYFLKYVKNEYFNCHQAKKFDFNLNKLYKNYIIVIDDNLNVKSVTKNYICTLEIF